MSRWFGSVDMPGATPAAVAVETGLERLFDDTQPALVQPSRSWIKAKGRGWPPPDLVPPDLPPSALPDWADCEVGIRIGHDTDPEADITVGVASAHAVVGCLGGRMLVTPGDGSASRLWTDEVLVLVGHALRAQYVWEHYYRGMQCVGWALVYDGVHVTGTEGRQVIQAVRARRRPFRRREPDRAERRVVTYGLQAEAH
jgi:hypothetical protein